MQLDNSTQCLFPESPLASKTEGKWFVLFCGCMCFSLAHLIDFFFCPGPQTWAQWPLQLESMVLFQKTWVWVDKGKGCAEFSLVLISRSQAKDKHNLCGFLQFPENPPFPWFSVVFRDFCAKQQILISVVFRGFLWLSFSGNGRIPAKSGVQIL